MGIVYNPLLGSGLDLVGTSSGGGGTTHPNVEVNFNSTTDWGSASGGIYTITISGPTHNKGPKCIVQVQELIATNTYQIILIPIEINSVTGDIKIEVTETPDARFAGRCIIAEDI